MTSSPFTTISFFWMLYCRRTLSTSAIFRPLAAAGPERRRRRRACLRPRLSPRSPAAAPPSPTPPPRANCSRARSRARYASNRGRSRPGRRGPRARRQGPAAGCPRRTPDCVLPAQRGRRQGACPRPRNTPLSDLRSARGRLPTRTSRLGDATPT